MPPAGNHTTQNRAKKNIVIQTSNKLFKGRQKSHADKKPESVKNSVAPKQPLELISSQQSHQKRKTIQKLQTKIDDIQKKGSVTESRADQRDTIIIKQRLDDLDPTLDQQKVMQAAEALSQLKQRYAKGALRASSKDRGFQSQPDFRAQHLKTQVQRGGRNNSSFNVGLYSGAQPVATLLQNDAMMSNNYINKPALMSNESGERLMYNHTQNTQIGTPEDKNLPTNSRPYLSSSKGPSGATTPFGDMDYPQFSGFTEHPNWTEQEQQATNQYAFMQRRRNSQRRSDADIEHSESFQKQRQDPRGRYIMPGVNKMGSITSNVNSNNEPVQEYTVIVDDPSQANLSQIMRQKQTTGGKTKGSPERNDQYDLNGRKSRPRGGRTNIQQSQKEVSYIIEDQYNALQEQYNEIFKTQQDYKQIVKNSQAFSANQQNNQFLREKEMQSQQRHFITSDPNQMDQLAYDNAIQSPMSDMDNGYPQGVVEGQKQQQPEFGAQINQGNNNNYSGNINYSRMHQNPQWIFCDSLIMMPDKNLTPNNLGVGINMNEDIENCVNESIKMSQRMSHRQHGPNRQVQGRPQPAPAFYAESNDRVQSTSNMTDKNIQQLLNKQLHQNNAQRSSKTPNMQKSMLLNTQNPASNSFSGGNVSSMDHESIERQNNEMLLQILMNNIKREQSKSKSRKYIERKRYIKQLDQEMKLQQRKSKAAFPGDFRRSFDQRRSINVNSSSPAEGESSGVRSKSGNKKRSPNMDQQIFKSQNAAIGQAKGKTKIVTNIINEQQKRLSPGERPTIPRQVVSPTRNMLKMDLDEQKQKLKQVAQTRKDLLTQQKIYYKPQSIMKLNNLDVAPQQAATWVQTTKYLNKKLDMNFTPNKSKRGSSGLKNPRSSSYETTSPKLNRQAKSKSPMSAQNSRSPPHQKNHVQRDEKLAEASAKLQEFLQQNELFKDIKGSKITSAMMDLLISQEQDQSKQKPNKKIREENTKSQVSEGKKPAGVKSPKSQSSFVSYKKPKVSSYPANHSTVKQLVIQPIKSIQRIELETRGRENYSNLSLKSNKDLLGKQGVNNDIMMNKVASQKVFQRSRFSHKNIEQDRVILAENNHDKNYAGLYQKKLQNINSKEWGNSDADLRLPLQSDASQPKLPSKDEEQPHIEVEVVRPEESYQQEQIQQEQRSNKDIQQLSAPRQDSNKEQDSNGTRSDKTAQFYTTVNGHRNIAFEGERGNASQKTSQNQTLHPNIGLNNTSNTNSGTQVGQMSHRYKAQVLRNQSPDLIDSFQEQAVRTTAPEQEVKSFEGVVVPDPIPSDRKVIAVHQDEDEMHEQVIQVSMEGEAQIIKSKEEIILAARQEEVALQKSEPVPHVEIPEEHKQSLGSQRQAVKTGQSIKSQSQKSQAPETPKQVSDLQSEKEITVEEEVPEESEQEQDEINDEVVDVTDENIELEVPENLVGNELEEEEEVVAENLSDAAEALNPNSEQFQDDIRANTAGYQSSEIVSEEELNEVVSVPSSFQVVTVEQPKKSLEIDSEELGVQEVVNKPHRMQAQPRANKLDAFSELLIIEVNKIKDKPKVGMKQKYQTKESKLIDIEEKPLHLGSNFSLVSNIPMRQMKQSELHNWDGNQRRRKRDYEQLIDFNHEALHMHDSPDQSIDLEEEESLQPPKIWTSLWSKDEATQKTWHFSLNPDVEDYSQQVRPFDSSFNNHQNKDFDEFTYIFNDVNEKLVGDNRQWQAITKEVKQAQEQSSQQSLQPPTMSPLSLMSGLASLKKMSSQSGPKDEEQRIRKEVQAILARCNPQMAILHADWDILEKTMEEQGQTVDRARRLSTLRTSKHPSGGSRKGLPKFDDKSDDGLSLRSKVGNNQKSSRLTPRHRRGSQPSDTSRGHGHSGDQVSQYAESSGRLPAQVHTHQHYHVLTVPQFQNVEYELLMLFRLRKFLGKSPKGAPASTSRPGPSRGSSAPNLLVAHRFQGCVDKLKEVGMNNLENRLEDCVRRYKYPELEFDKIHVMELLRSYYDEQVDLWMREVARVKAEREKRRLGRSLSVSDESALLDSTISDLSRFSVHSHQNANDDFFLTPLRLKSLQTRKIKENTIEFADDELNNAQGEQEKFDEHGFQVQGAQYSGFQIMTHQPLGSISSISSAMDETEPDLLEMQSPQHQQVEHCHGKKNIELVKSIVKNLNYLFVNTQTARENVATSVQDIQTLFFTYAQQQPQLERFNTEETHNVLESMDLKGINLLGKEVEQMWKAKLLSIMRSKQPHANNKKDVSKIEQKVLSKIQTKYSAIIKKMRSLKMAETSHLKVLKFFKLRKLINGVVSPQLDYDVWIQYRLDILKDMSIKDELKKLKLMVMESFWDDQALLDKFLRQKTVAEDCDNISISSSCDGEMYNNQYCIQVIHDQNNPMPLLDSIIKEKNLQYEIFKILSQTKLSKIKNFIMHSGCDDKRDKVKIIDHRFRQIQESVLNQQILIKLKEDFEIDVDLDLETMKLIMVRRGFNIEAYIKYMKHHMDMQISDYSSEASSHNSIEETATYLYVEECELQDLKKKINRRKIHQEGTQNEAQGRNSGSRNRGSSCTHSKFVYGFRYGNKPRNEAGKNHNSPAKEIGSVRLTNGLPFCLSDCQIEPRPNNYDFAHPVQRKKQKKAAGELQKYYNFVKKELIKSRSDKIIIQYRRQKQLTEVDINRESEDVLKKILADNISSQIYQQNDKQAICIDLTKQIMKRYVDPFVQQSGEHIATPQKNSKLPLPSESGIRILSKKQKFFTADPSQANGPEDQKGKVLNYRQGGKCRNFKIKCKLQSLGDFDQLKKLEREIQQTNNAPSDIQCFEQINDPYSEQPIYILMEVLYVQRKTPFDWQEEQLQLKNVLKSWTNFEIGGAKRANNNHNINKIKEQQIQQMKSEEIERIENENRYTADNEYLEDHRHNQIPAQGNQKQ